MIKILFGEKGTGKTKTLIATANKIAEEKAGDVVFIDDSNQLMYDLKHEIRFVNVSEFPVKDAQAFLGFICGIISEDYDINSILIDGLNKIVHQQEILLEDFFLELRKLSDKYNIHFYISMSGQERDIPEYIKEYV